jgi:hypothetical protein
VGLWRSWERASMAWKRSSVRSRSGPPINQQLSGSASPGLVAFGSKFSKPCCKGVSRSLALLLSSTVRPPEILVFPPPDSLVFSMGRDTSFFVLEPAALASLDRRVLSNTFHLSGDTFHVSPRDNSVESKHFAAWRNYGQNGIFC